MKKLLPMMVLVLCTSCGVLPAPTPAPERTPTSELNYSGPPPSYERVLLNEAVIYREALGISDREWLDADTPEKLQVLVWSKQQYRTMFIVIVSSSSAIIGCLLGAWFAWRKNK